MPNQLQKVINFSRKTGDRVIVFDSENSDESYVVMNLSEYEKIVEDKGVKSLTEGELLDRINRDIAIWKNQNDQDSRSHEDILKQRFPGFKEVDLREDNFDDIDNLDDLEDNYNIDDDTFYYEDVRKGNDEPGRDFEEIDDDEEITETIHNDEDFNEKNKEVEEDKNDFYSVKESIEKRRKNWNIPKHVKNSADGK